MSPNIAYIAGCAVCAAEQTPYGWFILAAVVAISSVALASFFAWTDR